MATDRQLIPMVPSKRRPSTSSLRVVTACLGVLYVCLCGLASFSAHAETDTAIRWQLLIGFDDGGHRLYRAQFAEKRALPGRSAASETRSSNRVRVPASMTVEWFDASGVLLQRQNADDPRLTRAPGSAGRHVLRSGAYRLAGPGAAVRLRVELPQLDVAGTGSETWIFELPETP